MKNKKCVFILPYFGKFKNYFPLFLKSCSYNKKFDWLIFTDSNEIYDYPDNVKVIKMTLEEMKNRISEKIGFSVTLNGAYKLCDYKPSFGFVFEEYIEEYDYWGHCDCDLIFGNLEKILMPLLDKNYDKIFATGHLTIYKNNYENLRKFMSRYKEKDIYIEAFSTNDIYVLDEDCNNGNNVHSIFLDSNLKVFAKDLSMNTSIYSAKFIKAYYSENERKFLDEPYKKGRYYWENGNLFRIHINGDSLVKTEYLYMHLQMRKMRFNFEKVMKSDIVEILPDRFIRRKKFLQTLRK